MFYTGIGSRKTPELILRRMWHLASILAEGGHTLRSGAAPGADEWFEKGCDYLNGKKEIYLPWKNFQEHSSPLHTINDDVGALEVAEEVWNTSRYVRGSCVSPFEYLKRPVKLLMGRNVYQVVGTTLDKPSDFVICWTPDGCTSAEKRTSKTGGTGQAIAHASDLEIPIFNLQREYALQDLLTFLEDK